MQKKRVPNTMASIPERNAIFISFAYLQTELPALWLTRSSRRSAAMTRSPASSVCATPMQRRHPRGLPPGSPNTGGSGMRRRSRRRTRSSSGGSSALIQRQRAEGLRPTGLPDSPTTTSSTRAVLASPWSVLSLKIQIAVIFFRAAMSMARMQSP